MTKLEGYVSRQEAARRAGVHYNTIRDWERAGKIRTERRQRGQSYEVMVETSSLEELMTERDAVITNLSDSERIIVLESENRSLRERLDRSEEERRRILDKLLSDSEA